MEQNVIMSQAIETCRYLPYQIELYNRAKSKNIVTCLDTDSSETLISILLMQDEAQDIRPISVQELGKAAPAPPALHDLEEGEMEATSQVVFKLDVLPAQPKKIIYLATNNTLVNELAENIQAVTELQVGAYNMEDIHDTILSFHDMTKRHVWVMAPDVLLKLLKNGIVNLSIQVSLIIFYHPDMPLCTSIIQEFYLVIPSSQPRPRIFGMLETPPLTDALAELEKAWDSTFISVIDAVPNSVTPPQATEVIIEYDRPNASRDDASSSIVGTYFRQYETSFDQLAAQYTASTDNAKAAAVHRQLVSVKEFCQQLGPWAASKIAHGSYRSLVSSSSASTVHGANSSGRGRKRKSNQQDHQPSKKLKLDDNPLTSTPSSSSTLINNAVEDDVKEPESEPNAVVRIPTVPSYASVTDADYSPKVHALMSVLASRVDNANFRCMIFVEQRPVAKVLSELLNSASAVRFPMLRTGYLIGHSGNSATSSSKKACNESGSQNKILEKFRKGEINTVVVTRLPDDGTAMPKCRLVVMFDFNKSQLGYVDSHRKAADGSQLIVLLYKNDLQSRNLLKNLQTIDISTIRDVSVVANAISTTVTRRNDDDQIAATLVSENENVLFTKGGVLAWADNVTNTLTEYCEYLKTQFKEDIGDFEPVLNIAVHASSTDDEWQKYQEARASQETTRQHLVTTSLHKRGTLVSPTTDPIRFGFAYKVHLPRGVPTGLESTVGPIRINKKLAMQAATLETCCRLYEVGALNEQLHPTSNVGRYNALVSIRRFLSSTTTESSTVSKQSLEVSKEPINPPLPSTSKSNDDVLHEYERAFSRVFAFDEFWEGIESSTPPTTETSFYVTLIKFGPELDAFVYDRGVPLKVADTADGTDLLRSVGILTRRPLPAHAIPPFVIFLNGADPCRVDVANWTSGQESKTVAFSAAEMHQIRSFQQYYWSFHHKMATQDASIPVDPRHFMVIPFLGSPKSNTSTKWIPSSQSQTRKLWPEPESMAPTRPCDWSIDWVLVKNVADGKEVSGWEWLVLAGRALSDGDIEPPAKIARDPQMNGIGLGPGVQNADHNGVESPFDFLFDKVYQSRINIVDTTVDPTTTFSRNVIEQINELLAHVVIVTPHNRQPYSAVSMISSVHPKSAFVNNRATSASMVDPPITYESYVASIGYNVTHPSSAMIEAKPIPILRNMAHPSVKFKRRKERAKDHGSTLVVPDVAKVGPIPMELVRIGSIIPSIIYKLDLYCLMYEFRERMGIPETVSLGSLYTAFSAPCAHEATDYDRHELLGDAFLKFATSMDLYINNPASAEGDLTKKRMSLASNIHLFEKAIEYGLSGLLIVDRFSPRSWSAPGFKAKVMAVDDSEADFVQSTRGWRSRSISQKMLADFVEALIGVCCVDAGYEGGLRFLHRLGIISESALKPLELKMPSPKKPVSKSAGLASTNSMNVDSDVVASFPYDEIEASINYQFQDRSVLLEAFTHYSYRERKTPCYERLEFLGDALLDWIVTRYFFNSYTHLDAGRLSDLRAATVNNDSFSLLAVELDFHKYVIHSSAGAKRDIDTYLDYLSKLEASGGFVGSGSTITVASIVAGAHGSGFTAPKILGDLFESVAGAILVDSGWDLEGTWNVVKPLMSRFIDEHATPNEVNKPAVRQIHEYFQGIGFGVNDIAYKYRMDEKTGQHVCDIVLCGDRIVLGSGNTKVSAKKAAATHCLAYIETHHEELAQRLAGQALLVDDNGVDIRRPSKSVQKLDDTTGNANASTSNANEQHKQVNVTTSAVAPPRTATIPVYQLPASVAKDQRVAALAMTSTQSNLTSQPVSHVNAVLPIVNPNIVQPQTTTETPAPVTPSSADITPHNLSSYNATQLQELGRLFVQLVQAGAVTISPLALINMGSSLSGLLNIGPSAAATTLLAPQPIMPVQQQQAQQMPINVYTPTAPIMYSHPMMPPGTLPPPVNHTYISNTAARLPFPTRPWMTPPPMEMFPLPPPGWMPQSMQPPHISPLAPPTYNINGSSSHGRTPPPSMTILEQPPSNGMNVSTPYQSNRPFYAPRRYKTNSFRGNSNNKRKYDDPDDDGRWPSAD
ncbi:hypothetical protein SmJEL517_g04048 [Synchytrium microbalum]|uniref:Uncharacterized protein n=1 Tax=Synchytrium microbalum TaxID=1806994 RepID=A0A507C455_9FUNG|nr:uncharacterized protein SmJEL517_g04048 [Synchytrium microbalum]TPX32894.1 hypothetical protein SmJEL517_g04048 [Synchytrium microbalum]